MLISLALFPIKWFWNTEFFPSNEFKVNFLRRKLKVGFKALNTVQVSAVLKTTLKCYQHSEAVVPRCSVKKVFLEISQNSQEKTCTRVSFLIKLQASGLRPATLLKKRLWHRCFPMNFVKFLRTAFFIEHLWWLLFSNKKNDEISGKVGSGL